MKIKKRDKFFIGGMILASLPHIFYYKDFSLSVASILGLILWGACLGWIGYVIFGKEKKMGEIENAPIKEKDEKKTGVYSGWNWLLWWKISPEELEGQVANYKTLKIIESARGVSFLLCIATIIITLVFTFSNMNGISGDKTGYLAGIIFEGLLFLIFGFFIYKGQRWATILIMILWTVDKSYFAYEGMISNNGTSSFIQLVWWCLWMHPFYVALKVENLRRRAISKTTITDDKKSL